MQQKNKISKILACGFGLVLALSMVHLPAVHATGDSVAGTDGAQTTSAVAVLSGIAISLLILVARLFKRKNEDV